LSPRDYCGPATPGSPFELPGLGSSDFARHYFRNHGCFLFLWVLRWFTSPGSLPAAMDSLQDDGCSHPSGFPIRKSPDHSVLATPRGLSQLAASFIAYLRQGIHTHALSSLTIKFTLNTECSRRATSFASRWRLRARGRRTCAFSCPSIFDFQRSRLLSTAQKSQINNRLSPIPDL
jgi:hypothetical protein